MSTPKGYPSQKKEDRSTQEFTTVQPISPDRHGMDIVPPAVELVGTDTAETGSTTAIVKATGHAARVGDVVRFTAGALSGRQATVTATATDYITLGQTMPAAPANGDALSILRYRELLVDGTTGELKIAGAISVSASPLLFTLNGSDQEVIEDTGTPANNRPLPVKIVSATGGVAVATEATLSSLNGKVTACNTGAVTVAASALPTGAATEATLSTLNGKVTACNTGAVTVSSSALPTGAATEATLSALNGKVTACNTGAVTVSSSALPTGAATEATLLALSNGTNLTVVDFIDTTPLLNTASTNIPASASAPLTIVASLAAGIKKVQFLDTTGSFIGLYSDPAGSPVLKAIFGPGSDQTISLVLPAATVLGLRNMENSAISSGIVAINFIG